MTSRAAPYRRAGPPRRGVGADRHTTITQNALRRNLRCRKLDAMSAAPEPTREPGPIESAVASAAEHGRSRSSPTARLAPPRHVPGRPRRRHRAGRAVTERHAADRLRRLRADRGAAVRHVSALYHRGNWSPRWAGVLKRLDHSNIFLIIAGTYTPFAVSCCRRRQRAGAAADRLGAARSPASPSGSSGSARRAGSTRRLRRARLGRGVLPARRSCTAAAPGVLALIAVGGAALHGGRARLRDQAAEPEPALVRLPRGVPRPHGGRLRRALRRRLDVGLPLTA